MTTRFNEHSPAVFQKINTACFLALFTQTTLASERRSSTKMQRILLSLLACFLFVDLGNSQGCPRFENRVYQVTIKFAWQEAVLWFDQLVRREDW